MQNRGRGAAFAAAMALTAVCPAGAGAAEKLYGVTESDRLVSFHSDSPGAVRSSRPLTGLRAGEEIVGLDVRPATRRLYGVSDAARLYLINPRRARARAVSVPFARFRRGLSLGFDFNPVADKLRLVTTLNRNLRVDPVTSEIVDGDPDLSGVQEDRELSYDANDPAFQDDPVVGSSAYTNSVRGATSTQLFGIDSARNTLVRQDPPNEGVLTTVGRLGVNTREPVSFDISSRGTAFASLTVRRRVVSLYRVGLGTGRAAPAAPRPRVGTYRGGRPDPVRAMASAGRTFEDKVRPRLRLRRSGDPLVKQLLRRRRSLPVTVSCSEACRVTGVLLMGGRVVGRTQADVLGRAGTVTLRLRLRGEGRRIVARNRPQRLTVGLRAVDAAGNAVQSRSYP